MRLLVGVAVAAGMAVAWWLSFVGTWCNTERHVPAGRGYHHE